MIDNAINSAPTDQDVADKIAAVYVVDRLALYRYFCGSLTQHEVDRIEAEGRAVRDEIIADPTNEAWRYASSLDRIDLVPARLLPSVMPKGILGPPSARQEVIPPPAADRREGGNRKARRAAKALARASR